MMNEAQWHRLGWVAFLCTCWLLVATALGGCGPTANVTTMRFERTADGYALSSGGSGPC